MGAERNNSCSCPVTKRQKITDETNPKQNDESQESALQNKLNIIFGVDKSDIEFKVRWDIFQHHLHSDPMNEFLEIINVHKSKAQYVFNNLDVDGCGAVAVKKLIAGLMRLRTRSRSILTPKSSERPRPGPGLWGPFTLQTSNDWSADEFKDLEALCNVPPRINTYHDPCHIWEVSPNIWTPEIDSRIRQRRDRHLDLACLQGLLNDHVLKREVGRILGPNYLLWRSFIFLTGCNTTSAITHSWHYDHFPRLLPNSHMSGNSDPEGAGDPGPFLTAWIALSDVPPESALEVLVGSWREAPGVTREQIGESIFDEQINVSSELERSRRNMSVRRGQFFIFDEFLLHRTAPNANAMSVPKRSALALRFVKSSCLISTESFPDGVGPLLMSGSNSGANSHVRATPCSWRCKSRRIEATELPFKEQACVIFGSFDSELPVVLAQQGASVALVGSNSRALEDVAFEVRKLQKQCFVVNTQSFDVAQESEAEIACQHISRWLACNDMNCDVFIARANPSSKEAAFHHVFTTKLAPKLVVKIPKIGPGSALSLAQDIVRWLTEDAHGQVKHHVPSTE